MKFLEIEEGFSVNVSEITSITKISDGITEIRMGEERHRIKVPYEFFRKMLITSMKSSEESLEQLTKYQTHFGG